jgi:cytochrome c oxidase subunit 1
VYNSRRLALYHCWVAFGLFLPAVVLGAWQMLMRSPLPPPLEDPNAYYLSVTLHGTVMAYVVTTFFAMGFGYAVTATSLGRPIRGVWAAWIGLAICLIGTVMAAPPYLPARHRCYTLSIRRCWQALGTIAACSCSSAAR